MKVKYTLTLCLLLLAISQAVYAQNLVPNPSFENYNACPTMANFTSMDTFPVAPTVKDWFWGWGSNDYYNSCAPTNASHAVPNNFFGRQQSRTGNGYVGGYQIGTATSYREFLLSHLSAPLVAGHNYYVSFWVSLAETNITRNWNTIATDEIGARFTTGTYTLNQFTYFNTYFVPQVKHPAGSYITDTAGWTRVEGNFVAAGGEKYMTLGYFLPFSLQHSVNVANPVNPQQPAPWGYYFFDDVCVMDLDAPGHAQSHDTTLCNGEATVLYGKTGMTQHLWSTGDTTSKINVNISGTYWVRSIGECEFHSDTFHVNILPPFPQLMPLDTLICTNAEGIVKLPYPDQGLLWWIPPQTAPATQQPVIDTKQPGNYTFLVRWAADTCSGNLTTVKVRVEKPPYVNITGATVCNNHPPLEIGENVIGYSYLWNTGETTCCIEVRRSGTYHVRASNACGSVEDTAVVQYMECDSCIWLPNVFTPNQDGHNDKFGALTRCPLASYQLYIFNRWGECVFSSFDIKSKWDGVYNGGPGELGTYYYRLEATLVVPNTPTIKLKGDVLLMR